MIFCKFFKEQAENISLFVAFFIFNTFFICQLAGSFQIFYFIPVNAGKDHLPAGESR